MVYDFSIYKLIDLHDLVYLTVPSWSCPVRLRVTLISFLEEVSHRRAITLPLDYPYITLQYEEVYRWVSSRIKRIRITFHRRALTGTTAAPTFRPSLSSSAPPPLSVGKSSAAGSGVEPAPDLVLVHSSFSRSPEQEKKTSIKQTMSPYT